MMVFSRGVIEQPSSSGEWVSGKSSKTSSWGECLPLHCPFLNANDGDKIAHDILNVRGNNTAGAIMSDTRYC